MRKISLSQEETISFGKEFATKLKKGDILILEGDLGAGKTHFVKGIALGLKSKDLVTSPTFTLLNVYENGIIPLYHFDMYRLSSKDEAEALGFEEYFDKNCLDGISIVEWPSQVEGLIETPTYKVMLKKLDDNSREIFIEKGGKL